MTPPFIHIVYPAAVTASVAFLAGSDVLAEVGYAVKILASGVLGGQGTWALIVLKMPQGALISPGEADHGFC